MTLSFIASMMLMITMISGQTADPNASSQKEKQDPPTPVEKQAPVPSKPITDNNAQQSSSSSVDDDDALPDNAEQIFFNAVKVFRQSRNLEYMIKGSIPALGELKSEDAHGKVYLRPSPEANDAQQLRIKAELNTKYGADADQLTLFWNGDLLIALSERTKTWSEVDFNARRPNVPDGGEWVNRVVPRLMFRDPKDLKLPELGHGLQYGGKDTINGESCYVFITEDTTPARFEDDKPRKRVDRWYIGVNSLILRQYELEVENGGTTKSPAQGITLEISKLRYNLNLDPSIFSLPVPEGAEPAKGGDKDKEGKKDKKNKDGDKKKKKRLDVGDAASDWSLKDPDGKTHRLSDYRGKVVMLDFWKTGCSACMQSVPFLKKFHTKYTDQGLVVMGVNAFDTKDPIKTIKDEQLTYPQVLKGDDVAKTYGVKSTPTFIVVGRDGKVVLRTSGHYDGMGDDMAKKIERILKNKGDGKDAGKKKK